MNEKSMYEKLGVESDKSGVADAFRKIIRNDVPGAWVNVKLLNGQASTMHADGDGSKCLSRILWYLDGIDYSDVFKGIVFDGLSMNTSDMAASGFVDRFNVNDTIAINGKNLPKDVILKGIADGIAEMIALYEKYGIEVDFMGGETADLPNQTSSMIFDANVFSFTDSDNIIKGNIAPGDLIYGFSSDGQAVWEIEENSGIMSNGLTLAQACLLRKNYYHNFPFIVEGDNFFTGKYFLQDIPERSPQNMTIFDLLTSPTRQWVILFKILYKKLQKAGLYRNLHGVSVNTGGGATKITNLGKGGIVYEKTLPDPPFIFELIQKNSQESWENMYRTFNCGIGIDLIFSPNNNNDIKSILKEVQKETGVTQFYLGKCKESDVPGKNHVELCTCHGNFNY